MSKFEVIIQLVKVAIGIYLVLWTLRVVALLQNLCYTY